MSGREVAILRGLGLGRKIMAGTMDPPLLLSVDSTWTIIAAAPQSSEQLSLMLQVMLLEGDGDLG